MKNFLAGILTAAALAIAIALWSSPAKAGGEHEFCFTAQQMRSVQDGLCYVDQTGWYMYHLFVQDECDCPGGLNVEQMALMQDSIDATDNSIRAILGLPQCEK